MKNLKIEKQNTSLKSDFFDGENIQSKQSLHMVLGVDQGIGGCVLDMGKTMGRVPRLETAENNDFLQSVIFFGTFLNSKNG